MGILVLFSKQEGMVRLMATDMKKMCLALEDRIIHLRDSL